jgi:DNA-binding transcriptional LysR family regulator
MRQIGDIHRKLDLMSRALTEVYVDDQLTLGGCRLAGAKAKDRTTIPLDLYCEIPQVQFAPDGNLTTREDRALAAIGRSRHIVLTVPDFFSLARVVAQSELIGGLPPSFARSISERFGLRVYTMPCKVDVEQLYLYWHRRHTDDPEHKWIRGHILELLRPLDMNHPSSQRGKLGKRAPPWRSH